jgi:hypothetical protein
MAFPFFLGVLTSLQVKSTVLFFLSIEVTCIKCHSEESFRTRGRTTKNLRVGPGITRINHHHSETLLLLRKDQGDITITFDTKPHWVEREGKAFHGSTEVTAR